MNKLQAHGRWMAAIACVAMIIPAASWGAEPIRCLADSGDSIQVADVRLDAHRRLWGQLVDRQGRPQSSAQVSLRRGGQWLARTQTGAHGAFHFDQLSGGVYQVVTADSAAVFRVWTPTSAPPAAPAAILLVEGAAVRGQQQCFEPAPLPPCRAPQSGYYSGHYDGAIMRTLSNPWVIGGAIAAGIAIPLALSDDAEGS